MPNPNLKKRVLIYTAGTVLLYTTAVVYLAHKYVQPSRQKVDTPAGLVESTIKGPHGEAPIWTKDVENPKAIVIFAHGYGGTRLHWPKLMEKLAEARISSVAIGMPGQEESPMPQVGFGGIEADIITDVANEVRSKNPKTKIILYGVSLGGASTWIAAGRNPEIADAVVTEAAYANLNQTSRRYLSLKLPAASPILEPIVLIGQKMANVDPNTLNPVDFAPKFGKPALLIHDDEDTLVTREITEELQKATKAELWKVPGAEHARAIEQDLPGLTKRLLSFIASLKA